jgi:hypothetical protein
MSSLYDFIEQSSQGSGFVYKNESAGFVYSTAEFVATTGTGTSVMTISSVTSGTVIVGMTITGGTLSGTRTIASFGTFNGTSGTVNLSGTDSWDNPTTVSGAGFIEITDVDYPEETVRGIVYLDGTYYVMTPSAQIYGSAINNPFSWSALNVISALAEPDLGVALFRQLNLIVAFGEYSTEFFYNAANPTGSPLLPYSSAFLELGCASANSIAQAENTLYFMGKAKQKGRSIYILEGTNPKQISTPFVDRIISEDDLLGVTAYFIKIAGRGFYILSLADTDITLVYDTTSSQWAKWTQLIESNLIQTPAMTWSNGVVTVVKASHGRADGEVVTITGATPTAYNVEAVITYVDANTFTFRLTSNPGTYVSGATITCYTEVPFNMASYVKAGNLDLVQDSTTGNVYSVDNGTYRDNDLPIKYKIRTVKVDGGNNKEKYYNRFELIGDKVEATAYARYTNDDYQTYSKYRPVDLSAQRSQLYRNGRGRRRAYEIINYDDAPIRLEAMEITLTEGIH